MEVALTELSFLVRSAPVAQPRQRHGAKVIGAGQARSFNYTDSAHPIHAYKELIQRAAHQALLESQAATGVRWAFSGPVHMGITCVFPRPASRCRKKDPPGRLPCDKKVGDVDNLAKAVMDACNGLLYPDDAQICSLYVTKHYAARDEEPHVLVLVQTLTPETDHEQGRTEPQD